MKKLLILIICAITFCTLSLSVFANTANTTSGANAQGDITFYNGSDSTVTAQVSDFGKFNLDANEQKSVPYSTLLQACASSPTSCTAHFYVNGVPMGSATINAVTGKLISLHLNMKVRTAQNQHVLRHVSLQ